MIPDHCASYVQHRMQNKTGACCLGALVRNDPSGLSIAIGLFLSIGKSTSCKSQRLISYRLTSGVIAPANSNRPKIKKGLSTQQINQKQGKSLLHRYPKLQQKQFVSSVNFCICMYCLKITVWSRKTTNEMEKHGAFQTTGFVK